MLTTADVNVLTPQPHVTTSNHVSVDAASPAVANDDDPGDDDVAVEMPPPMEALSRPLQPQVSAQPRDKHLL